MKRPPWSAQLIFRMDWTLAVCLLGGLMLLTKAMLPETQVEVCSSSLTNAQALSQRKRGDSVPWSHRYTDGLNQISSTMKHTAIQDN